MDFINFHQALFESWLDVNGRENKTEELLKWVEIENKKTHAVLSPCRLSDSQFWFYDCNKSEIVNKNHSFFTINGIKGQLNNGQRFEQPIIIQDEVGYLGLIAKRINGEIQFLMQAKIEPGNVNNVQISPTIQATKSNFTQKHGGKKPNYLDYFLDVNKFTVLYDGEESEQCSRFLKKFNRNVVIFVNDEVEVLPNFKWMSAGQIRYLATHFNNLVNMDTRTVLSCISYDPFGSDSSSSQGSSLFFPEDLSGEAFMQLANFRSKAESKRELIRLDELNGWVLNDWKISCNHEYPFEIQYFDISINGREVTHWSQPLAVARGQALFGLFVVDCGGAYRFLIRIKEEIGCMDIANFGPTIQMESTEIFEKKRDSIESLFFERLEKKEGILVDVILSEEGGRFYHEENENVLLRIKLADLPKLPKGYFLVSYTTLHRLIAKYHCLNIQLRDLVSLLGDHL